MANTGVAVVDLVVVNTATTADHSVVCCANGSVRRIPIANSFNMRSYTPANSTVSCAQGQIWFDANYIYVAVANNLVKRAPLQSF